MKLVKDADTPTAFDSMDLRTVKRRFMALNNDRLKRVYQSLRDRQQIFFELLPLLFHINHPLLPGYLSSRHQLVSPITPRAIALSKPADACPRVSATNAARNAASTSCPYLMGSSGTIAYSDSSDFDFWLCIRPDLDSEELQALARKAEGIESWAATLGMEVHFFVMSDEAFRRGEMLSLSEESSGSAQHHLLLDEFYRTGLLVAGRYPLWWLVPPDQEANYDQYAADLKRRRFVGPNDTVDFGGLERTAGQRARRHALATL